MVSLFGPPTPNPAPTARAERGRKLARRARSASVRGLGLRTGLGFLRGRRTHTAVINRAAPNAMTRMAISVGWFSPLPNVAIPSQRARRKNAACPATYPMANAAPLIRPRALVTTASIEARARGLLAATTAKSSVRSARWSRGAADTGIQVPGGPAHGRTDRRLRTRPGGGQVSAGVIRPTYAQHTGLGERLPPHADGERTC